MPQRKNILPYIALVAGILALGVSAMFIRWAKAPGPVTGFYRNLISAVILTGVVAWRRPALPSRRELLLPILSGLFTSLDLSLWAIAVQTTAAGVATLLNNTAPLWVALIAWIFFREKLDRGFWLGLALTLAGAGLIAWTDFTTHARLGLGDGIALISGIFYAAYFLTTQRGRESVGPLAYIWIVGIATTAGLLVINLVLHNPLTGYPATTWLLFLGYALVSQLIGYASLTYALGHLPASVVSPTMILQPVLTILLAIPILGEVPGPYQTIGSLLALGGIFLVHRSHNKKSQVPLPGEIQIT
jgi:drug/metabolite transporter (DMT)-like permease